MRNGLPLEYIDGEMKLFEAPRLPLNCIVKGSLLEAFHNDILPSKVEKGAFASQMSHRFLDRFI